MCLCTHMHKHVHVCSTIRTASMPHKSFVLTVYPSNFCYLAAIDLLTVSTFLSFREWQTVENKEHSLFRLNIFYFGGRKMLTCTGKNLVIIALWGKSIYYLLTIFCQMPLFLELDILSSNGNLVEKSL